MAVDVNEQLAAQLVAIAQQSVASNAWMSAHIQHAATKDLYQGGQGETAALFAALNAGDRTPVVKEK